LIRDLITIFQKKEVIGNYYSLISSQVYEFSLLNEVINKDTKTLEDVSCFLSEEEGNIEEYLSSWTGISEKLFDFKPYNLHSTLDKGVRDIIKIYNLVFKKEVYIYLLLDASYTIPNECQEIVNILLQRGYIYRTKLAIRPYDWKTLKVFEGRALEINNDFFLLSIEYPEEEKDNYKNLILKILNRLIEDARKNRKNEWKDVSSDITILNLLGEKKDNYYSGFEDIYEISSENPHQFLLICSKIFKEAIDSNINPINGIPPEIQDKSIREYSEFVFLNVGEDKQRTLESLLKEIKSSNTGNFIKIRNEQNQMNLFEDERFLEEKEGEQLKPFFTYGLFRFKKEEDVINLERVPKSFNISKIFFPKKGLSLKGDKTLEISLNFIKESLSLPLVKKPQAIKEKTTLKAFLSVSFGEKPYTTEQRRAVKEILKEFNIECYDAEELPKGEFLLPSIQKYIKEYDFTIFDVTEPIPNVMFEMGICAGLKKPVIPIFNEDAERRINELPEYIQLLSIIPYTFKERKLIEMAEKIKENFYTITKSQPFEKTKWGSLLRTRKQENIIYLSYPKERKIWGNVYPRICSELESQGYRVINEDNAPFDANPLQKPIFCISLANYVFIDTTTLDLLQCYKLGVCNTFKRIYGMRIEETSNSRQEKLLWKEPYAIWKDIDNLIEIMIDFIKKSKRRRELKKNE
jgi:nucleoside 2-deoxyribosyltransferase